MAKAITAAMIGQLVDEDKLSFTTQLKHLFPNFERDDAAVNITIADLLSHRTGLPSYDSLWTGSDNEVLLERSKAIPILSYVPAAMPLRTSWIYNNMQYEVLGQVLERVTGQKYAELLHERIVKPLHLNRTVYTTAPFDDNTARSYAALSNGSSVEIPDWGHGRDVLIGAAGGVRSSVSDLLVLYKSFIDAANEQMLMPATSSDLHEPANTSSPGPLKQMDVLLQGMVAMPVRSVREKSYAGGWVRAQLPNIIDHFADYEHTPVLGAASPSRLMLNHQGYIAGNVGYVSIFPETSTAVVVLGNSAGLTDAMRLIGQALVEMVFGGDLNQSLYLETARQAAHATVKKFSDMKHELLDNRTVVEPIRSLEVYAGRYCNSIGNYFIDITLENATLSVAFMRSASDTFLLQPYQSDEFFWFLDFDESARRARLPFNTIDYFVIKFGCSSNPPWWNPFSRGLQMQCLTWKHEPEVEGPGETFRRLTTGLTTPHIRSSQEDL